jgi:TetR/AcrR family transcriptional repressor of nem operon
MARPREFDRDEALGIALQVFMKQGYRATTTDDLRTAMKIGRQSLYDTFGDKHALYLEAFQRYNTLSIESFIGSLVKGASAPTALVRALTSFANSPGGELELGCLGINATCEFGRSDPDVAELIDASASTFSASFSGVLSKGRARGELRSDMDERKAAAFLVCTLAGMKVSARAGATRKELNDIAEMAVQSLVPPR